MRWLILLLFLSGCTFPETSGSDPEPAGFHPVLYVTFEHPEGDHVDPQDVILGNEWPPTVCACSDRR
jgi:hypothetical protein